MTQYIYSMPKTGIKPLATLFMKTEIKKVGVVQEGQALLKTLSRNLRKDGDFAPKILRKIIAMER